MAFQEAGQSYGQRINPDATPSTLALALAHHRPPHPLPLWQLQAPRPLELPRPPLPRVPRLPPQGNVMRRLISIILRLTPLLGAALALYYLWSWR